MSVLATDLEFCELQTLANLLLQEPLDNQLRPVRQASLELDLCCAGRWRTGLTTCFPCWSDESARAFAVG